jgi:hypothetical protein
MLALLAPGALLALAALALPPLLHLRRRSEQQVVRFAALRWLGAGARPRHRIRLEQKLMLALRLALLAVLALLLARPAWRTAAAAGRPWVLLMPGLNPAAAQATPDLAAAEGHWLAPGFPLLSTAIPASPITGVFSLLRQLDVELPPGTALQILVPQELTGLDAERPRLQRPLNWQVVPGSPITPSPPKAKTSLELALRYETTQPAATSLVTALATAWRSIGLAVNLEQAQGSAAPDHPVDALFWLGAELPPSLLQWARDGGTLIAAAPAEASDAAMPAAQPLGQGRLLLLAAPLDPAGNPALRDPALPTRMLNLLRRTAAAPDRAPAASVAPRGDTAAAPERQAVQPLDACAAVLAALLFLAERIMALRARARRP